MNSNQKNIFIYQASAGSGKTETLAREYVRLILLSPDEYKHTIALTFTNEATREMKLRIISILLKLGDESEVELTNVFQRMTGMSNIKSRASSVLTRILHDYSNFSVTTIDSFFSTILRSLSGELRISPGFKIEMDQDNAIETVTHQLLDSAGKGNTELTSYIEKFIIQEIENDKGWKIDIPIKSLSSEVFKDRYWELNDAQPFDLDNKSNIKELNDYLRTEINNFEYTLRNYASDAIEVAERNGLCIEDFKWKNTGVLSFFYKLIQKQNYHNDTFTGIRILRALENIDDWYLKDSTKKDLIRKAYNEGMGEMLKNVFKHFDANKEFYFTALEVQKTLFILGIFKDILFYLKEYRKKNNIIFIHDINNIIRKVIFEDNSHFIYEKTGNRFRNFLIDEFQDTSNFQWQGLLPLLINSISEKNFLMLVGDVKQSIYRWRGGNIKLMAEQIYHDLKNFLSNLETVNLENNYRSGKVIVDFNNKFFEAAALSIKEKAEDNEHKSLIEKTYNNLYQRTNISDGYVRIELVQNIDDNKEIHINDLVYEKTKSFIKEINDDGYSLNDILILVRTNKEGRNLSAYLTSAGYKVFSTESLLLKNSPKVKFILNLFKYIISPSDKLAQTECLFNLSFIDCQSAFSEDTFYYELFNYQNSLFEKLITEKLISAGKTFPELQELSMYELAETIISIFLPLNQSDAYLIKFLDAIAEFENEISGGLTEFIEWWQNKKNDFSIAIPSTEEVIRIMTIHKSKGLQSKAVIIPFANWDISFKQNSKMWVSSTVKPFSSNPGYLVKTSQGLQNTYFKNQYINELTLNYLDNLNTLYVAFTRPSERLYVLLPGAKGKERISTIILESLLNAFNFITDSDESIFETGRKTISKRKKTKNVFNNINVFLTTDWKKNIRIKTDYLQYKKIIDKTFSDKTDLGLLLHEVLSKIKTTQDADKVLSDIKTEYALKGSQAEILELKLLDILKDNTIKNWFDTEWEVMNEKEILLPEGKTIRPDRVVYKDENAIVIDYKTGVEKAEHKSQLFEYGNILKRMGFKHIKMYLLYLFIDEGNFYKVIEVA